MAMKRETKRELTAGDYKALASFRYAIRRYLAFAAEGAQSAGLTSQQHQALLAIKAGALDSPVSVGDLAAQLMIKHHSAVELINRLERIGLASRSADPDDRRKVFVGLTDAGERVLAALSARNLKELEIAGPGLSGLMEQLHLLEK